MHAQVFGVGASSYNAATHQTTFNFTSGGNQGSRGGNAGQVSGQRL